MDKKDVIDLLAISGGILLMIGWIWLLFNP
jgi:uncharacterized membrane protein YgdD (TMEM256/DUF423 family)